MNRRVVATVASVVAAAATGVVTNVLSNNWALTWWLALGALVVLSVVLQLVIAGGKDQAQPRGPVVGPVSGDSYIAGRDITINHPPERRDSHLELSSVTLTETGPRHDSSAVLDLKLRNTGDQPAIVHRARFDIQDAVSLSPYQVVGFLPHEEFWIRGALHVSQTYDLALPCPDEAAGTHHVLDLSQAIEPAGTDRFHIRFGIPDTQDTLIYLLSFQIHYDTHGTLASPAIAIAHPPGSRLATAREISTDLAKFGQALGKVRAAVDQEMIARGLPAPDWADNPPTKRSDLPPGLRSVDGDPKDALGMRPGTYKVTDAFWNPKAALTQRLGDIFAYYERVVRLIEGADVWHDALDDVLADARTVLIELREMVERSR